MIDPMTPEGRAELRELLAYGSARAVYSWAIAHGPALLDALDKADEAADKWAESAADGFGIKSLNTEGGRIDLKMVANNEDAEHILLAMSDAMGMMIETHDAPNYVEFDVAKRGRSKYTVTVRKSVKPTPHQLRQKAEERAEKAEAALDRVRELTYASDDGTEYDHNGPAAVCGEPECPACWATAIRRALDGDS